MDFDGTVGLLFRGSVRRYLKAAEFHGHVERWIEIKGLLKSKFLIKGASDKVVKDFREWANS